MEKIISNTADFVRKELEWLCSAHDFYHIERVWKLARKIHAHEKIGDILVIELGALLHESFDDKFYSQEEMQAKRVTLKQFLEGEGLDEARIKKVFYVVENVGYGKSLERGSDFDMTDELMIVEDADRLESIWAIAIGRTFSYGGKKKRPLYDPEAPIVEITDNASYKNVWWSSVQHFYDKLLKLKDLLHTATARDMAHDRHAFMERFLEQFHAEWNGEV